MVIKRHRSAKSGQFVTKTFAIKHKATTVAERIKPPCKTKPKK